MQLQPSVGTFMRYSCLRYYDYNDIFSSISGMASLAKIIIAMEENVIPANLHFSEPNENIPYLLNGKLQVVAENKPWNGGIAALNSFGFGGANAHAILKSNSHETREIKAFKEPRLFIYGSRTQDGVESVLNMAMKYPQNIHLHKLLNETAFMSIDTHPYRGFTVLNNGQNNIDIQVGSLYPRWMLFRPSACGGEKKQKRFSFCSQSENRKSVGMG